MVDRIAVVVGKTVITESEVLQEVRLTQFLNGQPLDLGPEQRRAAADRLVDQELIREERRNGHYPEPDAHEADDMLRRVLQDRHQTDSDFQASLSKYGLTEDQLRQHLLWQIAAIRFTDMRFQPGIPAAPGAPETANRLRAGATAPAGNDVDAQMDAWLKEARSGTRVVFKKEAFQ